MKRRVTVYTTSYCNKGHRLKDGVPVGHECYVLPPKALAAERRDEFVEAMNMIEAARPLRVHRGARK